MKKICGILICILIIANTLVIGGAAPVREIQNPFASGVLGSEKMRIPSLLTLADGRVMAACDLRWNHGLDSPNNVDTAIAFSPDGYGDWTYTVLNRFDDFADGADNTESASFIDPSLLQDPETGRIFVICDAYAGGYGYPNSIRDSGVRDGKPVLTDGTREYLIERFREDRAAITLDGALTEYSVDREYRLYRNDEALYTKQRRSDGSKNGVTIRQSVFYADSPLRMLGTSYLWLRWSDDGGASWSDPMILNDQVKSDEAFLGVCPGRGCVTRVDGKTRLVFPLYTNGSGKEQTVVIYSDDHGESWTRGQEVENAWILGKTSESQILSLPDGTMRMFSRTKNCVPGVCDSSDGGETWTKSQPVGDLIGTKNCMFSVLAAQADGKTVYLCSRGSAMSDRADGTVFVGKPDENQEIAWTEGFYLGDGFYAYSCLEQLPDGNIALLYEDEPYHIEYRILRLQPDGSLLPADGSDAPEARRAPFFERIRRLWWRIRLCVRGWFVH